jgi:hypothetical protein
MKIYIYICSPPSTYLPFERDESDLSVASDEKLQLVERNP